MKFNKKMLFATIAQVIFAIFAIIALFGTGFDHGEAYGISHTVTLKDFGDMSNSLTGDAESIYALSVTALVLVFVAIIMPFISLFVDNKEMNKWFGLAMIIVNIASFAFLLAAFGMYANDSKEFFGKLNNAGYIAGSFIFTIVGAGLGLAGNIISYKEYLTK